MDVIARALAALVVRRNFAMSGVGFVPESERDTIAQAADFSIRREDIDTVVVYGVVGDRFIEGSLRTHSPSVDPAAWLERPSGSTTAGARTAAGAATRAASASRSASSVASTDRAQLWRSSSTPRAPRS